MASYPEVRLRRLRRSAPMRRQMRENRIDPARLVLPVFVTAAAEARPIPALPGHSQLPVGEAAALAKEAEAAGIGGVLLFGLPAAKDEAGTGAWDPEGPVPAALRAVAAAAPGLVRWADVCLCQYTSHGHCGVLAGETVDNDATLPLLSRAAVAYADAGADVVAPSDMMDGRMAALRRSLDGAGHHDVAICSYAAKFASAFYGPFRDAAGSAPAFGDRRSHQLDPANGREAQREIATDVDEGADLVMVKPAGPYLDVLAVARREAGVPVVAYQVSGEYAALHAAADRGWLDLDAAVTETLTGIVRAGADVVITYFAIEAARMAATRG
jgi:porphobilinogen synthase